jgi:hypothetical protein
MRLLGRSSLILLIVFTKANRFSNSDNVPCEVAIDAVVTITIGRAKSGSEETESAKTAAGNVSSEGR